METITTTVETADAAKLCDYVHELKREGSHLMAGNTGAERAAGSRIWGIADQVDMLLNKAFGYPAKVSGNAG
jgi:hypothetical protein